METIQKDEQRLNIPLAEFEDILSNEGLTKEVIERVRAHLHKIMGTMEDVQIVKFPENIKPLRYGVAIKYCELLPIIKKLVKEKCKDDILDSCNKIIDAKIHKSFIGFVLETEQ